MGSSFSNSVVDARPLYAVDDPSLGPVLRAMADPVVRFALVSLAEDLDDAVDLFREWHAMTGTGFATRWVWDGRLAIRPERGPLTPRVWEGLTESIARGHGISVNTGGLGTGAGFSLVNGQLGLWYAPAHTDDERARPELERIVDGLMIQRHALQALSSRWAYTPSLESGDHTPYEIACGITTPAVTSPAWCRRWLRGVGERVWLGPDLRQHLEREPALIEGADVVERNGCLKLYARDLTALEHALSPILPRRSDAT